MVIVDIFVCFQATCVTEIGHTKTTIAEKSNIAKFTFELYILNQRILPISIIASSFEYYSC